MSRSNPQWHVPGSSSGGRSSSSDSSLAAAVMRRVWLLETLHRVNSTIHEQDDVENSLPEVARSIFEEFGLVSVGIGVLEDGWIHYRGVASRVSATRNRVPVVPFDPERSQDFPASSQPDEDSDHSDIAGMDAIDRSAKVPIRVAGEIYGVLSVAVSVDSRLSGEELEILEQIAAAIGAGVERSRRRNEEFARVHHLGELQSILGRIQDHIDTRDHADDVLRDIEELLGVPHVSLGRVVGHEIHFYDSYRNAFQGVSPAFMLPVSKGVSGRAARSGRAQLVRDVRQDPDYAAIRENTATIGCIPLWSLDEVIGILRLESDLPGGLADRDLEVAAILADRFNLVFGSLRRQEEIERRSEQIRIIERVTATIGRLVPTRASIADVVGELQATWGPFSTVGLIRDGRIVFHAPEDGFREPVPVWLRDGLPMDEGICGRVARNGEAEFVREVEADPDYLDAGIDAGSEIVIPIKAERRVIGVLNVEATKDRPLDDVDFETLSIIAHHLGIALANYDAFSTEQDSRRALEAVQRVSTIVAGTLDPAEALRLMAETLAAVLHYPIVSVEVIEGERLNLAASFGFSPGTYVRQPLDSGIVGRVIGSGEIEFLPDIGSDHSARPLRDDALSGIYVPIRTGSTITGMLTVQGTRERHLSDWDAGLLRTFAESAGVMLANTQAYAEMRSSASIDSITGVPNHRYFQQRLRQTIETARRDERSLSLLVIDIDTFKDLNDRFGHIEGDHVLSEIAARINSQLRSEDVLARYAGDEFVVILPDVSMRVSLEIAARLLRAVRSRPFSMTNGETVVVTLSIGAATYPEDAATDEELISAADTAMYLAKGYGRDAVCHFRDVALLESGESRNPIVRLNP